MTTASVDQLAQENEALRRRLEEAEDTIRALRAGEVDAVLIDVEPGQVYTLEAADTPYRLAVEQMPNAAATLTREGTIIYCNRRFQELLQRPLRSLVGAPLASFADPDDQPRVDALLRGGGGEVSFRRADGTTVDAYLGVSTLEEGARGSCFIVSDLTEHRRYVELRRAQQALVESEKRMADDLATARRVQEISTRLIQEGDVGQLYNHILDAAVAIMRADFATMQKFDPASGSLQMLIHRGFSQEFADAFQCVAMDARTTCGQAARTGRRVVAPDLETFEGIAGTQSCRDHLEAGVRAAQSTPLLSRSGTLLGMISTHWRTPHEPAESDLRLIDVLARQAADLIERKQNEQALRDADRRKDEFLATLAHELRNPLAPIRNAIAILMAKGPPEPELQWARGVIDRQLRLMSRLLEDLLDVSRISHNKLQLRTELVELKDVVAAALESSGPFIEAGGHELTVRLPPDPIFLQADAVRLAEVFANLLINSAKYTVDRGHIALSAVREDGEVVVTVRDDGIGIPPEVLPRIFEIFAQSPRAQPRAQGGLGVGLALVKGLVELHGGRVEARSDGAGKGSEFVVRLPLAVATAATESLRGSDDEQRPIAKRSILMVDDNRDSADSLAMLLEIMGHEVATAYDGEQALKTAAALRPEIILLDIGMPKLDGYEVCRRIREQPWGQKMFVVALSGWGQEEDRRRTDAAGFDHHLVKPVEPDVVLKVLAAL